MGVSTIGPSGLDPFSPTSGPAPEEIREATLENENEAAEPAPLPEGSGTMVDTSA